MRKHNRCVDCKGIVRASPAVGRTILRPLERVSAMLPFSAGRRADTQSRDSEMTCRTQPRLASTAQRQRSKLAIPARLSRRRFLQARPQVPVTVNYRRRHADEQHKTSRSCLSFTCWIRCHRRFGVFVRRSIGEKSGFHSESPGTGQLGTARRPRARSVGTECLLNEKLYIFACEDSFTIGRGKT